MELKAFKVQGVRFSDQYFTEETVEWLLKSPKEPVLEALPPEAPPVERSPEQAFAEAWDDISKDPELAQALGKANYSQQKGQSEFVSAIAAPLAVEADTKLVGALKVDYATKLEDGTYVHRLNGLPILMIPSSVESAPRVSANADAVLYGLFLVVDVLSIVAAAASVKVFVQKEKVAKSLQGPLKGFLKRLFNPAAVAELKKLEEAGKKLELIRKVLGFLRGSTNLKAVLGTFLSSLSWIDKAVAVLQLIASILLLIGTGGASFAAKVISLAGAIVMFIADLVAFSRALQKG